MDFGVQIIPSRFVPEKEVKREQVIFPKSKGKRIRKKFAKDNRNYVTTVNYPMVVLAGKVYAHPNNVERLKQSIK